MPKFQAINNLTPSYISDMFTVQNSGHNTKCTNLVIQQHYNKVTYGVKTFKCLASHLWNNLPDNIRAASDLDTFNSLIDTWYGSQCKCAFCKALSNINYN